MPIEFRCYYCNQLLRIPDDSAGQQVQCPECHAVMESPEQGNAGRRSGEGVAGQPFGSEGRGPQPTQGEPFYQGGPPGATSYGQQAMAIGSEVAAARVSGPATALLVTGIVGLVLQLLGVLGNLLQVGVGAAGNRPDAIEQVASGTVGLGMGVVAIGLSILVIVGASRMKNLENYGLSMTAAIVAMIPCIGPCCLIGLPFGIWALIVLNDPRVRDAFRS